MADDLELGELAPEAIEVALRDLVQSSGWALLKAEASRLYGPEGYGREMQRALSTVQAGPDEAYELARVAKQVDFTARAVQMLMRWPEERLQQAAKKKTTRAFDALRRITR